MDALLADRARASARPRPLRTARDPARRGPRSARARDHRPRLVAEFVAVASRSRHARSSRRCRRLTVEAATASSRRAGPVAGGGNSATGTRCCARRYTDLPDPGAADGLHEHPSALAQHATARRAAEVARHLSRRTLRGSRRHLVRAATDARRSRRSSRWQDRRERIELVGENVELLIEERRSRRGRTRRDLRSGVRRAVATCRSPAATRRRAGREGPTGTADAVPT